MCKRSQKLKHVKSHRESAYSGAKWPQLAVHSNPFAHQASQTLQCWLQCPWVTIPEFNVTAVEGHDAPPQRNGNEREESGQWLITLQFSDLKSTF